MSYYYVMHKDFAAPLLAASPHAAKYDGDTDDTKQLRLGGVMPPNFDGEIVRICDLDITMDELSGMVDALRAEKHTGKLIILSKPQGRWLYDNHKAFKSTGGDNGT